MSSVPGRRSTELSRREVFDAIDDIHVSFQFTRGFKLRDINYDENVRYMGIIRNIQTQTLRVKILQLDHNGQEFSFNNISGDYALTALGADHPTMMTRTSRHPSTKTNVTLKHIRRVQKTPTPPLSRSVVFQHPGSSLQSPRLSLGVPLRRGGGVKRRKTVSAKKKTPTAKKK